MKLKSFTHNSSWKGKKNLTFGLLQKLHLDPILFTALLLLFGFGIFILYSASNQSFPVLERQLLRISVATVVMVLLAQVPPAKYQHWAPWFFVVSLCFLLVVLIAGEIGHGAKRWLSLGVINAQPSELMLIALPLILSWYFHAKPLPPNYSSLLIACGIIAVPFLLIAKQPDLGTAILIATAGMSVLWLIGMNLRIIFGLFLLLFSMLPVVWHFMRDYQQNRVLTFLDPARDPLGSGYHIIQSKIAIGSGGAFGKGWLMGTQSHLRFLPEHATDFIFAVCGEELGLVGCIFLLILYTIIIARCFYIASKAQTTFTRLLAGSLTSMFFVSMFINIGMVIGIVPVVGLPLPLISYGGSSIVTFMAGFGVIMAVQSHRKLIAN